MSVSKEKLDKEKILERLKTEGPTRWYHKFEIIKGSGIYTPGVTPTGHYNRYFKRFGINKKSIQGKRVLDIGAYTGFMSFYFEDLGADVTALDIHDPKATGFSIIHEIRNSSVKHVKASVYDLNPEEFGKFDLILFFGVLYHLKHPILALERINSVCANNGKLFGATAGMDGWFHDDHENCDRGANFNAINKMRFFNRKVLTVKRLNDLALTGFVSNHYLRDRTNWFVPNESCVKGWLKRTGFSIEKTSTSIGDRLVRDWNKTGVTRSGVTFLAHYSGEPEPEYLEGAYRYNPEVSIEPMHEYKIPLDSEVMRLKKQVLELQTQVEGLKKDSKN